MATTTCPACRSINHEGISRCMNCGAPMELPAVPIGVDLDDLPAAPPPQPSGYGWNAMVQQAPKDRSATWSIAVALGLVAVLTFLASIVMIVGSGGAALPSGAVAVLLTVSWAATGAFWLWMLIEAISNSRVGWALLIFFFGVIPAFCYALFGRTTRTASF